MTDKRPAKDVVKGFIKNMQPSFINSQQKVHLKEFAQYYFTYVPDLDEETILYLLEGTADKLGLLKSCGNTDIKTVLTVKQSSIQALELVYFLLEPERNRLAESFLNCLKKIPQKSFRAMKLDKHILGEKTQPVVAFNIIRMIQSVRPEVKVEDYVEESKAVWEYKKWYDINFATIGDDSNADEDESSEDAEPETWADVKLVDPDRELDEAEEEMNRAHENDIEANVDKDPLNIVAKLPSEVDKDGNKKFWAKKITGGNGSSTGLGGTSTANSLFQTGSIYVSRPDFNPVLFLTEVHKETPLSVLERGAQRLQDMVRGRSTQMKSLVQMHFGEFVYGKDTIDRIQMLLQGELTALEDENSGGKTGRLQVLLSTIEEQCQKIYKPLLDRKAEQDRVYAVLGVLKRCRFLFAMPGTIKANIREEKYDKVVRDYHKAKALVLEQNQHKGILQKVVLEVLSIIDSLRTDLLKKLEDPRMRVERQQQLIGYLVDLDCPIDPAWHYLFRHQEWICQLMDKMLLERQSKLGLLSSSHPGFQHLVSLPMPVFATQSQFFDRGDDEDYDGRDMTFVNDTFADLGEIVRPTGGPSSISSAFEFDAGSGSAGEDGTALPADVWRMMESDDLVVDKLTAGLTKNVCIIITHTIPDFHKLSQSVLSGKFSKRSAPGPGQPPTLNSSGPTATPALTSAVPAMIGFAPPIEQGLFSGHAAAAAGAGEAGTMTPASSAFGDNGRRKSVSSSSNTHTTIPEGAPAVRGRNCANSTPVEKEADQDGKADEISRLSSPSTSTVGSSASSAAGAAASSSLASPLSGLGIESSFGGNSSLRRITNPPGSTSILVADQAKKIQSLFVTIFHRFVLILRSAVFPPNCLYARSIAEVRPVHFAHPDATTGGGDGTVPPQFLGSVSFAGTQGNAPVAGAKLQQQQRTIGFVRVPRSFQSVVYNVFACAEKVRALRLQGDCFRELKALADDVGSYFIEQTMRNCVIAVTNMHREEVWTMQSKGRTALPEKFKALMLTALSSFQCLPAQKPLWMADLICAYIAECQSSFADVLHQLSQDVEKGPNGESNRSYRSNARASVSDTDRGKSASTSSPVPPSSIPGHLDLTDEDVHRLWTRQDSGPLAGDKRLLAIISNIAYTKETVLLDVWEAFLGVVPPSHHRKVVEEYEKQRALLSALSTLVCNQYVRGKTLVLNSYIREGLFKAGVNWKDAPAVVDVRGHMLELLTHLVLIRHDLYESKQNKKLVELIFTSVFENVMSSFGSMVAEICPENFDTKGCTQVLLEADFLQRSLSAYSSEASRMLGQQLRQLFATNSSGGLDYDTQETMLLVHGILETVERSTSSMFDLFRSLPTRGHVGRRTSSTVPLPSSRSGSAATATATATTDDTAAPASARQR